MGTIHVRVLLAARCTARSWPRWPTSTIERATAASRVARGRGGASTGTRPDVVHDPGVDAVVVASSDATHEALVLACLEAGKPVLCEKPLAATRRARACGWSAAEAALGRRLVQVGFMRRFDPGYAGAEGAPSTDGTHRRAAARCTASTATRACRRSYTSEMLVTNTGVHEIDVARWLLGEEIVAGQRAARRARRRPAGGRLRDPQIVVLETRRGRAGRRRGVRRPRSTATTSAARWSARPAPRRWRRRARSRSGAPGTRAPRCPIGFAARFDDAYRRELQAWVDGIAAGRADGPSAWDGYAASAVAETCLASLADGGAPRAVDLAPRPELYAPESVVPAG